jgi:hypothetical protein
MLNSFEKLQKHKLSEATALPFWLVLHRPEEQEYMNVSHSYYCWNTYYA